MSATIIQFRPKPNPHRDIQAVEISNVKLLPNANLEAFIDPSGYVLLYQIEPDTAPSEYSAPQDDPA